METFINNDERFGSEAGPFTAAELIEAAREFDNPANLGEGQEPEFPADDTECLEYILANYNIEAA